MSQSRPATSSSVPVTVVTGYLGAGKTTLVNAVLRQESSVKIAVIVNEFGQIGIDHDLMEVVDENVVLLSSGCICCSVRGDISQTVKDLLDRRKAGHILFDRIILETTGLAAPGPILQTLTSDRFLASAVRLDGVVTVVDAVVGSRTLDREFEATSQVALADLLVLTKADKCDAQDLMRFETRLRSLNPTARILRARHGRVPLRSLWKVNGFRGDATPTSADMWLTPKRVGIIHERPANLSGLPSVNGPETNAPLAHDVRISTASIVLDEPVAEAAFDLWLDTLIALRGADILRVKGIVHIEGLAMPFVFHGVQHVFDRPLPLRDWPDDDHRSRIVVIARNIPQVELSRSLEMLRARPADDGHLGRAI